MTRNMRESTRRHMGYDRYVNLIQTHLLQRQRKLKRINNLLHHGGEKQASQAVDVLRFAEQDSAAQQKE